MERAASFRRELEALPGLFELVEAFAAGSGLNGAARYPLDFALEELFTNMVKYNPGGKGEIRVALSLEGNEVRVVIEDPDSDRFDLNTDAPAVDTDLPLEARSPGGLGLHLVKQMMDRVEYEHAGRTSTIRLFKRVE